MNKSLFRQHKTPLLYVNATMFSYAITMLTSFVTYRYITPEYLGIWATFTTFSTLATFLRLGIVNGMNRELPYYLGKGDKQAAYSYAETTLSYTLFTVIILILTGIVALSTWNFAQYGILCSSYRNAAIVFFLSIAIEPYKAYVSGTFRTNNSFDQLSKIQIICAIVRIPTLGFVIWLGYNGFLIREAILFVLEGLLLHFKRPLPEIKPIFNWNVFKKLFQIGFNIFLVSYLSSFVDTFPRLFLIHEGTTTELGLFSPVLMLISIVYLIPGTLSNYLYPKFSFAYGNGVDKLYFWKRTIFLVLISTGIGILFSIVMYFIIDYIIPFFPKYIESVPYIKMMCVGLAFVGYKVCSVNFVIFKSYLWMWLTPIMNAVLLMVSLWVWNYYFEDNLTVAVGSLISSNFLMLIIMIYAVYKLTHKKQ